MSTGGYGLGGGSSFGPSRMFAALPWKGWREVATWVEEWIDACGMRFDILDNRYISASARSNLLDPTVTPTDIPSQYLATSIAPGTSSTSTDTMLDVLLFIALGIYPVDSNLTAAQKQALVRVGWDAIKRKGTRAQLLNVASKITDGCATGWTTPGNFSIIVPDGTPSPGQGSWSPPASTTAVRRPWVFDAIRQCTIQPAFIEYGVGYSQFRAGFSAAGEPVFGSGTRLCILVDEHFSSWTTGVPDNWTHLGSGTLTQSTAAASINHEFTNNAAVLDLSAAGAGTFAGLSQAALAINNRLTHRVQLDYSYTNTQNVAALVMQVIDANTDGSTYYWNPTTAAWSTTEHSIPVAPSSSRARFAFDVVPQLQGDDTAAYGTTTITVKVFATSDGTSTTKILYTLYRLGLFEAFQLTDELSASGERTLSLPLRDAPGWATATRTAGASLVVPTNALRNEYKILSGTLASFAYHPSLGDSSFRAHTAWINLLKGSNDFGTDWTATNCTVTAAAEISPIVGELSATAPQCTLTVMGGSIKQTAGGNPASKTFTCGLWVKKLSSDSAFTDVTLSLVSTTTKSKTFNVTQAQGWVLLPFTATFAGTDTASLVFKAQWGAATSNGSVAVATSYLYDVTATPGVLYPPVGVTTVGSTATLGATDCLAITSGADVLHPLLLRAMVTQTRGALGLTIVPTFDAASQPNGVIFDSALGAAQNRLVLRVASHVLEFRRWDNAGNQWVASLALSLNPSPAAGSMTWARDEEIVIRCAWDGVSTQLSAGNGNASGTIPGSWAPAETAIKIAIGNDYAGANAFNGHVTLLEVDQSGAPTV